MTTPSHTVDDRTFNRVIATTRDKILLPIKDQAFNHSAAVAVFFNQLLGKFGTQAKKGMGINTQRGGESIAVRMNLGKGQAGVMAGPWDTHGVAPSDTIRNSRALWKHYWANITMSDTDLLVNTGAEQIVSLLEFETTNAFRTLADLLGDHIYDNSGVATRITSLDQAISSNDQVQGLNGNTHPPFNSRGMAVRNVTALPYSFDATGAFSAVGLQDMNRAYYNAVEGDMKPNVLLQDFATHEKYENSLQAQQRFTNRDVADAAFENVAYKRIPAMPDDKAPANSQWFLHVGDMGLEIKALAGADFTQQPFKRAPNQEARVSEIQFKGNLIVHTRKFSNKIENIS